MATSTSSPFRIWCMVLGVDGMITRDAFAIHIQHAEYIGDLKELVFKRLQELEDRLDLPKQEVWIKRAPGLQISDGLLRLQEKVPILYQRHGLQTLATFDKIADLGIKKDDILFIDVGPGPLPKSQLTPKDLELSNVIEEQEPNPIIQDIEKQLDSPRPVDCDKELSVIERIKALLLSTNNASSNNNASPALNNNTPPASDDIPMSNPKVDNDGYPCSSAELFHIGTVLVTDYSTTSRKAPYSSTRVRYNETYANAAIFYPFAFALRDRPNFTFQLSGYSWPINIFIEVNQQIYSYHPKSNFLFQHGGSIWFMAEVQSSSSKVDQHHMLLQAAYFVKFANNHFQKYKEKKDFFLVADSQENDPDQVKYSTPRVFGLNIEAQLISFIRELYNLASRAAETEFRVDLEDSLAQVDELRAESQWSANDPGINVWTVTKPHTCNEPHGGFGDEDECDECAGNIEVQG
ncbi:hypothetical protein H1R20_g13825, partial [Candolleomyces eurysporus]